MTYTMTQTVSYSDANRMTYTVTHDWHACWRTLTHIVTHVIFNTHANAQTHRHRNTHIHTRARTHTN